ncbi:hypothetical protein DMJ13_17595 [halophilic archaeon]|nr:hypothetical protein DMJ13_17595 [halophilic archaeon]
MPEPDSNQHEWDDIETYPEDITIQKSTIDREPVLMLAWSIIGSLLVLLVLTELVQQYDVPIALLVLLFLGQSALALSYHYCRQIEPSLGHQLHLR